MCIAQVLLGRRLFPQFAEPSVAEFLLHALSELVRLAQTTTRPRLLGAFALVVHVTRFRAPITWSTPASAARLSGNNVIARRHMLEVSIGSGELLELVVGIRRQASICRRSRSGLRGGTRKRRPIRRSAACAHLVDRFEAQLVQIAGDLLQAIDLRRVECSARKFYAAMQGLWGKLSSCIRSANWIAFKSILSGCGIR